MTADPEAQAQRWHDTDHGNGPPGYSSCWCCCESCDPDYQDRPNPFWSAATASLRAGR